MASVKCLNKLLPILIRKQTLQSSNGLIKNRNLLRTTNLSLISIKYISTTNQRKAIFNIQDEEDFQDKVMKSEIPVVVDFHASWCGPCKILGPRLEVIIGSKAEKVHLAKINIDKVSDVALEYGVSAVPSVLAFKGGKLVDKFVGLQDESRIETFVKKLADE